MIIAMDAGLHKISWRNGAKILDRCVDFVATREEFQDQPARLLREHAMEEALTS